MLVGGNLEEKGGVRGAGFGIILKGLEGRRDDRQGGGGGGGESENWVFPRAEGKKNPGKKKAPLV